MKTLPTATTFSHRHLWLLSKLYDFVIHKQRTVWNAFLLCLASSFAYAAVVTDTSLPPDTIINVSAQQGVNFSQSFKGIGTTDNIYTLTEALPAGLTATTVPSASPSTSNHSLVISGTPTVAGTFLIPVRITATSSSVDTAGGVFTYSTSINFTISAGPPTVQNRSVNLSQDSSSNTISLTTTGDIYQIQIASAPTHGTATTSGTDLIYTPTAGYYGSDSVSVVAIGPTGSSAVATISINVQATAPSIVVSPVSVFANTSNNVIAPTLTGVVTNLVLETAPAHGTATISGTQVLYTPTAGYVGNDTLTLKAQGPGGDSRSTPVAITVNAAPPVSADYAVTVSANSNSNTIHPPISGTYVSLAVDSGPSNGSVVVSGKDLIYTPTPGFSGSDSIKFKAIATASVSNVSTLSITVLPPAPSISGASITIPGNSSNFVITPTVTGAATSLAIVSPSSHGTITVSGMHFEYTPTASYAGSDSFTAYASGPGGNSSTVTFNLTVLPIAPSTSNMSLTVAANSSNNLVVIPIVGVASSSTISVAPLHGTVASSGLNFSYTPNAGYDGNDSFSYIVVGPGGSSAAATASILVLPPAPSANNSSLTVTGNSIDNPVNLSTSGNVTGITVVTSPSHGSVRVSGTSVFYTPTTEYSGNDSFVYVATGPGGSSSNASVSVTVQAIPPSMSGASLTVPGNSANYVITPNVSGNATGLTVVSAPTHGTVTTSGMQFQYTPTTNYAGTDSFTAYARGPGGNSSTVTFNLTVLPIAPSTSNTSATVLANSSNNAVTIPVVGNATSLNISTQALHGTVQVSGLTVTYTPNTGFVGNDSFSYVLVGPGGNSTPATASIVVQALPPSVSNSSINVSYGSTDNAVPLTIVGSYTSVTVVSPPAHGNVRINDTNIFYSPSLGYSGPDSFSYTASGPGGTSTSATVSVNVAGPSLSMSGANLTVPGNSSNFIITPSITGSALGLTIVSPSAHGTVTSNGLTFEYTPNANYAGADSFTAYARGTGANSSTVTFNLTVLPIAPSTSNTSATVIANSSNNVITIPVMGNATGIAVSTQALHGTVQVSGLNLTYTPTTGYDGNDNFSYYLVGPGGNSNIATASIIVQPLAPLASNSAINLAFGSSDNLIPLSVTGNYASVNIISSPSHGYLRVTGTSIFYTPTVNYSGSDTFTYTVTGAGGSSSQATVAISVATPTLTMTGSSITVPANSTNFVITPDIIGNANGLTVVNPSSHGTVITNGLHFEYTPTSNYAGPDSFTAYARSPVGNSSTVTFTITVSPNPPSTSNTTTSVMANASNHPIMIPVVGTATSITVSGQPSHGSIQVTGLNVSYTPQAGYVGNDSFTYYLTGPGGNSISATATIIVQTPTPNAANSSISVAYGSNDNLVPLSVSGTYSSVNIVTAPAHGSLRVTGMSVFYSPNVEYSGLDSFSYSITGPGGTSTTATVSINVLATALTIYSSNVTVPGNSSNFVITPSIIGNATGLTIVSPSTHGTVTSNGLHFEYTPNANYTGADSFAAYARGINGNSNTVTFTITVLPLAPSTNNTSATVLENSSNNIISIPVMGNATSLNISTQAVHGTVQVSGLTIAYTPNAGYIGNDSFSYIAVGPGGSSSPATASIVVQALAPSASNSSLTVSTNSTANVVPLTTNGHLTSLNIITPPAHGSLQLNGTSVLYTPAADYYGTDSFIYAVTGPGGTSNNATVSINVLASAPSVSASSVIVGFNSSANLIAPTIAGRVDSISITSSPSHGTAQVIGLKLNYTPTSNYSGSDQISFQAQGPGGISNIATINITVQAGVITVQNLQFNVAANSSANALTPLISGVADQLTIQTAPAHGSASVNGLGVLYTPSTNYVGTDNITINISGPGSQPATATLVVNVTTPAPTIAVSDIQILANTTNVSLTPQLTGLVDSLLIVTPPNHGSASVNGLTLRYTPNANFVGLDSFTVIAKGLGGNSTPATVQVKVNELPPVVNNDSLTVVANSANNAYTPKVTGAASSISISKQPTHGSVSVSGMAVNYIPSPGYVGPDSFSVVANGVGGTSTPADISINVQAIAGITETLSVATNETGTATLAAIAGASAYVMSTPPQHGTASIQGNQLRYTPSTNYVGNDVVRITINGSNGALTSITYNIAVVATAPTTRALSLQVESGRTVQIDLATAVSGPVYTGLTLKIVTPPSHGTATLNGSTLSFTANSTYTGNDQLQFTASTIGGTSNLANLSIAITARPDPSQDKSVLALANATSAIVRHFEQIQIEQFNGRLIELQSQYRSRSEIPGKQEKDCGPIAMWLSGLNSYGSYRTRDGSHYTTMAYSAGGDRCFASGKITGGFGLGYARDHAEIAPSGINLTSSANTAAGYMNANIFPKGRISFVAGTNQINTGYQRFEANSNAIAYGKWNGTQAFSSSSVSNDFDFGVIVFSPFVRFDLSNLSLDPYSETGASKYNLHYHAQSMKSRRSTVGFNSEMSIETAWGKLVPRLRAEFQRDSARRDTLKTNYVDFPDAVYLIPANDSDRRATLMMIGADMYWSNGMVTILNFNHTSANQGSKNNRITLRFSYQF